MNFQMKETYTFADLLEVMSILRSENGCMWDREQDHKSIRRNFIEEVYEVCEAIDNEDSELLKEELGDVLFQVVFHTEIEKEKGVFDINDVADGICKKMIYRHPHVFGDVKVSETGEILNNWDELKKTEKHQRSASDTLNSVARSLPSLIRADKIQSKAAKVGFDWEDIQGTLEKVHEELNEVEQAVQGNGDIAEELGDLLFAVVNVARFADVDPEQALECTCEKFIRRFSFIEQSAAAQERSLEDMSLMEMDALWNKAKEQE
ncbi:MAG: nucleoside triphosphate pyrophosphohydrolase [Butyricicoccus sp.]